MCQSTSKGYRKQDLNPSEKEFPLDQVTIEYSVDGHNYQMAGEMHAVPGRWVGVKNGVFCASVNKESKGYAVIHNVEYYR